jgi:hypothetical protein
MRPKKHKTTGSNDLFRARLDQIINLKHELVLLAGKIDWDWIDGKIAPLYSENGRRGIETRFMIGLLAGRTPAPVLAGPRSCDGCRGRSGRDGCAGYAAAADAA